jgi:hypothetical protein
MERNPWLSRRRRADKTAGKESAVFTLSGVAGFTEADIQPTYAFGLGTAPDSLLTPEPATLVLLGLGSLLLRKRG